MKPVIINIIIFYGLLVSCYKPYDPDIVANDTILVVEGMITNEEAPYHINLRYAAPFNSEGSGRPENSAIVYVTDDLGNNYSFRNVRNGDYVSYPSRFTGNPGSIYTLSIETPDGEIYKSDPQQLQPAFSPDSTYAIADYKETLSRFNTLISTLLGANILLNVRSDSDTLPHFRFTVNLVRLYNYLVTRNRVDYMLYCWNTDNTVPDINLTHKEYTNDLFSVSKHAVYFADNRIFCFLPEYSLGYVQPYKAIPTYTSPLYPIAHRILYLDMYSINNETYSYYKSMDEQLRSEGKLFDPVAVQLRGNIHCTSDPGKKVLGFFEASSVSRTAYKIGFRTFSDQFLVKKVPYIMPPEPEGCLVEEIPPFWIH